MRPREIQPIGYRRRDEPRIDLTLRNARVLGLALLWVPGEGLVPVRAPDEIGFAGMGEGAGI